MQALRYIMVLIIYLMEKKGLVMARYYYKKHKGKAWKETTRERVKQALEKHNSEPQATLTYLDMGIEIRTKNHIYKRELKP